jgi:aspartate aminotransferase
MSYFTPVTEAPPIEVFYMNKMYQDDPAPNKVNLTIGGKLNVFMIYIPIFSAYRTEEGKSWVLPVVRQAEIKLANDETLDHEYLPVLGLEKFTRAASELVLGSDSIAFKEGRAFGVQCLSGTGSLRAGGEFLNRLLGLNTIYISNPTWGNHKLVFTNANFKTIKSYRYWDTKNRCVDIDGLCEDLEQAPEKWVLYKINFNE